jgi:molybdopterin synthase sulfur carrier subunit
VAIRILYFAWVREKIGLDGQDVSPPESVTDVAGLIAWLGTLSEGHAEAFADSARIRAAVDNRFAKPETSLSGAREIALFPPVTGG